MQALELGIAHGVTAAAVEAALKGAAAEGRRVGAVLMVRALAPRTSRMESPCCDLRVYPIGPERSLLICKPFCIHCLVQCNVSGTLTRAGCFRLGMPAQGDTHRAAWHGAHACVNALARAGVPDLLWRVQRCGSHRGRRA